MYTEVTYAMNGIQRCLKKLFESPECEQLYCLWTHWKNKKLKFKDWQRSAVHSFMNLKDIFFVLRFSKLLLFFFFYQHCKMQITPTNYLVLKTIIKHIVCFFYYLATISEVYPLEVHHVNISHQKQFNLNTEWSLRFIWGAGPFIILQPGGIL